jgi:hypothetical protein
MHHQNNAMRNSLVMLSILAAGVFACGRSETTKANIIILNLEHLNPAGSTYQQESLNNPASKFIYTQNAYADSIGNQLTIQNSLPKGGLKYTAPSGEEFVYAVFWTCITNETAYPLNLKINFPDQPFKPSDSEETYCNLLFPTDKMTPEKESFFDYGLANMNASLDHLFNQPSELSTLIEPKASHTFYVVSLCNQGVKGTIRAELSLREQMLYYRLNNKEIPCGEISFQQLKN